MRWAKSGERPIARKIEKKREIKVSRKRTKTNKNAKSADNTTDDTNLTYALSQTNDNIKSESNHLQKQ